MREFWQRWHISLSTFLRDYLYIPLGGNRGGAASTQRNLMITMLLGGLWHGASWNFVMWGALHGLFLSTGRLLSGRRAAAHDGRRGRTMDSIRSTFSMLFAFTLVMLTFITFRAPDFATTLSILEKLFIWQGSISPMQLLPFVIMPLVVVLFDLAPYRTGSDTFLDSCPTWLLSATGGVAVPLVVGVMFIMKYEREVSRPFIYFQF
jgi:D-alanyl-lipoteichoic acid acyltransferase DltB (MBOAT superfamily)